MCRRQETRSLLCNLPLRVIALPARDTIRKEFLEELATGAELLLVFPGVEADALTYVARQQPTQMTLPGLIDQTRLPLTFRTLQGFPTGVGAEVGAVVVNHEEQESSFLHGRARIPPTLFATLNRPQGGAQHVGKLGLTQSENLPNRLEIDAGLAQHGGFPLDTGCPAHPSVVALRITM
jgi:hypothetical protein